ncbi:MAG: Twitching motility protein, partial [Parcubacteria group bacterium GW2011_GWE2_39_37]
MNIKDIFSKAIEQKASDIHLVVGMVPMLRVDGELIEAGEKIISKKEMEQMIYSILTDEQKKTFLENKDLDFGYETDAKVRLRVNVLFEKNNIGLVARLISTKIPTMKDIGMP